MFSERARPLYSVVALVFFSSCLCAGESKPANLKTNDEIATIRMLWTIAQSGKAGASRENDIAALMTQSWEGRRLSKWCLHALVKIGVDPAKHMKTFREAAIWMDKLPPEAERKKMEPEWRKYLDGPELPADLQAALPEVWKTVASVLLEGYEKYDQKTFWAYRDCIQRMNIAAELVVPKVGEIIADTKRERDHRMHSVDTLGGSFHCVESVDPLIKGLADPDKSVRYRCAAYLAGVALERNVYAQNTFIFKHPAPEKTIAALEKAAAIEKDPSTKGAMEKSIARIKEGK
jgi:hypothetical protein